MKMRYFVGFIRHSNTNNLDQFGNCHIILDEEPDYIGTNIELLVQKEINTSCNITILSCSKVCDLKEGKNI